MKVKNLLAKSLSFFDGNVKFQLFTLKEEIEIWKLFIQLYIDQKEETSFKIKATVSNKLKSGIAEVSQVFEFDVEDIKRTIIFGNPFERSEVLVNHVLLEYYDYSDKSLVYLKISVYEIDEGSREDLFPFSISKS